MTPRRNALGAFEGCGHAAPHLKTSMQYRQSAVQGHPVMSQTPIFTLATAGASLKGGFHG